MNDSQKSLYEERFSDGKQMDGYTEFTKIISVSIYM